MKILLKTLALASLFWTSSLHARGIHLGLDGIVGIHYNTLDAASYKTPIGDFAVGMHVTLLDPDDYQQIYFNGRFIILNDFETYTVFPGAKLDCALRDFVCSFQAHKKLNERLSVYSGINLSFNVINTIWFRTDGSVFTTSGQRMETIEDAVKQKIRKLNAGVEVGCTYPLGKGFSTGLHLAYNVLDRLHEDIELGQLGTPDVSLNFKPLALRILLMLELY